VLIEHQGREGMPSLVRRPMAESCPRQRRMLDDLEQNILEPGITQCRLLEPFALTQGIGEPVYCWALSSRSWMVPNRNLFLSPTSPA
jgi:hypothetical protein